MRLLRVRCEDYGEVSNFIKSIQTLQVSVAKDKILQAVFESLLRTEVKPRGFALRGLQDLFQSFQRLADRPVDPVNRNADEEFKKEMEKSQGRLENIIRAGVEARINKRDILKSVFQARETSNRFDIEDFYFWDDQIKISDALLKNGFTPWSIIDYIISQHIPTKAKNDKSESLLPAYYDRLYVYLRDLVQAKGVDCFSDILDIGLQYAEEYSKGNRKVPISGKHIFQVIFKYFVENAKSKSEHLRLPDILNNIPSRAYLVLDKYGKKEEFEKTIREEFLHESEFNIATPGDVGT